MVKLISTRALNNVTTPTLGAAYLLIAADVFSRFYKLIGEESSFQVGYYTSEAQKCEISVQSNKTRNSGDTAHAQAQRFLNLIGVKPDQIENFANPDNFNNLQKTLTRLYEQGYIYLKEEQGYYCNNCERYLLNEEIEDGKCLEHDIKCDIHVSANYSFRTTSYLDVVRQSIKNNKLLINPEQHRDRVIALLNDISNDLVIAVEKSSTITKWCPLPFDDDFFVCSWVPECFPYFFDEETNKTQYGSAPSNTRSYFVDYDDLAGQAIHWPAILLALGQPLPDELQVCGYWSVKGTIQRAHKKKKNELSLPYNLIKQFGQDSVRYFLQQEMKWGESSELSLEGIAQRKQELESRIAKILNCLSEHQQLGHTAIGLTHSIDSELLNKLPESDLKTFEEYKHYMISLQFTEAWNVIWLLIENVSSELDSFSQFSGSKPDYSEDPWAIEVCLWRVHFVALLIRPMLPNLSDIIFSELDKV